MASSNVPFKSALDSFLDRRNEASDREVKYAQLIQQARIQNEQLAIQQSQERRGIVQQGQNMRLNEINMRGAIDANQRANSAQAYADATRQLGFSNLQKQADIEGYRLNTDAQHLPMQAQAFGLLRRQQLFNAEYNDAFIRKDTAKLKELTGKNYFVDDQDRVFFEGIGSNGSTTKMYPNGNTQEQTQIQDNVKTAGGQYTLGMLNNLGNPAAGAAGTGAAGTGAGGAGAGGADTQSATGFSPTLFASPPTRQASDAAAVAPVFNAGRGSYAGFDPNALAPTPTIDLTKPATIEGLQKALSIAPPPPPEFISQNSGGNSGVRGLYRENPAYLEWKNKYGDSYAKSQDELEKFKNNRYKSFIAR